MEEETFFNSGGITVTRSRFVVHGQTYTMQGVTSIRREVDVEEPSRGCPITLLVIGGVFVLTGVLMFTQSVLTGFLGLIIGGGIAFGGFKWLQSKQAVTTYIVTLSSASGESRALESQDRTLVDRIVEALNRAIVARG